MATPRGIFALDPKLTRPCPLSVLHWVIMSSVQCQQRPGGRRAHTKQAQAIVHPSESSLFGLVVAGKYNALRTHIHTCTHHQPKYPLLVLVILPVLGGPSPAHFDAKQPTTTANTANNRSTLSVSLVSTPPNFTPPTAPTAGQTASDQPDY